MEGHGPSKVETVKRILITKSLVMIRISETMSISKKVILLNLVSGKVRSFQEKRELRVSTWIRIFISSTYSFTKKSDFF